MRFCNITNTVMKYDEDYIKFYLIFDHVQERFVPISLPMAFNSVRKPKAFIKNYVEKNKIVMNTFVDYVNKNLNKHFTTSELDKDPLFKFAGHNSLSLAVKKGDLKVLTSRGPCTVFNMNIGADFYTNFVRRAEIIFDSEDSLLKLLNTTLIKDIHYYSGTVNFLDLLCLHYEKGPNNFLVGRLQEFFNFEQVNLFNFFNKEFRRFALDAEVDYGCKEYLVDMFYNIILLDRYFKKLGRCWNPTFNVDWDDIEKETALIFKKSCQKFGNSIRIDKEIKKKWEDFSSKPDKDFVRYSEEELKKLLNVE
jgi:hypothetical protein